MQRLFAPLFTNFGTTILLVGAIMLGSGIGSLSPDAGDWLGGRVDRTILTLVTLLFVEIDLASLRRAAGNRRFLAIAWVANFLIIPTIGYVVASTFLSGRPLFMTGLVIYFMSPCTDWFLGFTRLAKGNASLGATLLPLNMVSQLLLYPVYLEVFTRHQTGVDLASTTHTVIAWFLIPFVGAVTVRTVLQRMLPVRIVSPAIDLVGKAIPFVIATVVVEIFAANITTILDHATVFLVILVAVFIFFVATYWLGEGLTRLFRLAYPEHALLTMTTAARNAPLMLGITVAAIPDQPLVYAALIIGMLVEFPHLTALKHLLLRARAVEHPGGPDPDIGERRAPDASADAAPVPALALPKA